MNSPVLPLRLALAAVTLALPALAGTFKHITIDGAFSDWAGVPPAYEDGVDTGSFSDFKAVYVANDEQYLYVRFTLHAPFEGFSGHNNFYFDTDNDPTTGYRAILGSEMLVEGGAGYQEKNGTFNEGTVSDLGWAAAPSGTATDFEFRVARTAKFDSDSTPVFGGDTIALLLEATDPQWNRADTAPDTEGLAYTFAPLPAPLAANLQVIPLTGSTWRLNAQNADPGASWNTLDYDDSLAGWSAGSALFGFAADPGVYPAPIATSLASTLKTLYLRQHFTWANAADGVVLVVTNYLSDGAVFYLNGAEARRIRLPEGAVTFGTPATGGPAAPGQPEIIGLATDPLIQGDNVLAVEVHQSAGDTSDLVFGASLLAAVSYPVTLTDPTLPADLTVVAGDTATFTVAALATPPVTYQWYHGPTAIPDATNATLTLAPALVGDAGDYLVQVSNPLSTNVTSRTAKLTVTQTTVVIDDPGQPADQTVGEGQPVSFTVVARGSAPLSFQWFKGDKALTDATNATLSLAEAVMDDAGLYFVRVTNPMPSSVDSRKASLVVIKDTTPPALSKVEGGPNQVIVTFSEPVDPASSSEKSNYGLSGGVTVNSAAQSVTDPTQVVLATSGQVLGTLYTLSVSSVQDRFGNAMSAVQTRKFRSTILIDGSFEDWAAVPLAYTDAQEDPAEGTDFKDLWVTNDERYLYIRFSLYKSGNPNTWLNNIFIDTDNSATTGFIARGVGSELLVQQGAGYQEKNGGFNEGDINGLDWAVVPTAEGTDFECRISRQATYASDGQAVFAGDTIRFMLETEDANYNTTDTAPDSAGLEYTFVNYPPTELAPLHVTFTGGQVTITWTGPGLLQYTTNLTQPTWTSLPAATSGYATTPDGQARYYRLSQ